MAQFTNVSITKEANIYFGGNVTSRTVHFSDGTRKTLGIMLPGDYEFNTDAKEIMEILSGDLEIQLAGESWKKISSGESFEVPASSGFKLKIHTITDYCCSYLD
ncbi:MAG: pyrimidine/purine nucleoside phosphorylase [Gammaproteobacteria bacterium]|nr:pyrimidine/purine nucleoside phosphorylase [Gammaproteobacteria bacterium]MDH5803167.1 pyrimidine/purine nucleoside phosphorylase [Gammaproteobacteria bacterium]